MRASQIALSWKLPATTVLFAAALIVFTSGAKGGSRLLTEREKEACLAAQGASSGQVCYYIVGIDCAGQTNQGSANGCGASSFPNCGGSCNSYCFNHGTSSFTCLPGGVYIKCPKFPTSPQISCGAAMMNGSCTGMNGACYCVQGDPAGGQCGKQNLTPKFPALCF